MANAHIIEVGDADFQAKVLNSALPVIVDFWAPWCGPCRQIAPLLDELATQYAGQVVIAKINVDNNNQTAARLGISGIPTLLGYKGGELVGRQVGFSGRAGIENFVKQVIG